MCLKGSLLFGGDYYPGAESCLDLIDLDSQLVANLECALDRSQRRANKAHSVCITEQELAGQSFSRFVALNVANNHVLDSGLSAFRDMIDVLASKIHVTVYGTTARPYAVVNVGHQRWAIIGCLERCRARQGPLFREEDVAALVRAIRNKFDRIFVTPHWGKYGEFAHFPSPQQLSRARDWMDAGVDGVLGHHPHTVQSRQIVGGRRIYYSLGNLWFPHEQSSTHEATRLCLLVHVAMERATEELQWSERFVWQQSSFLVPVSGAERTRCADILDAISEPLKQWSWFKWAQLVGETYVRQSSVSWQRRIAKHGWCRTFPLMLAWNMHPVTCLLRLGRLAPKRFRAQNAAFRIASIGSTLSRHEAMD